MGEAFIIEGSADSTIFELYIEQILAPSLQAGQEEAFSKLKAFLRRVGARTPEALQEAIGQALLTITVQDAHGWFGHCGYPRVAA